MDIPGHGRNKINASYAFGGPSLLIQTVEQLTQVRIDHYVAIDFDGIIQVTDDLGGVDVVVAESTKNGRYTFPDQATGAQRNRIGPAATWTVDRPVTLIATVAPCPGRAWATKKLKVVAPAGKVGLDGTAIGAPPLLVTTAPVALVNWTAWS